MLSLTAEPIMRLIEAGALAHRSFVPSMSVLQEWSFPRDLELTPLIMASPHARNGASRVASIPLFRLIKDLRNATGRVQPSR